MSVSDCSTTSAWFHHATTRHPFQPVKIADAQAATARVVAARLRHIEQALRLFGDEDRRAARCALILDEVIELLGAAIEGDEVLVADALADLWYVVVGTVPSLGMEGFPWIVNDELGKNARLLPAFTLVSVSVSEFERTMVCAARWDSVTNINIPTLSHVVDARAWSDWPLRMVDGLVVSIVRSCLALCESIAWRSNREHDASLMGRVIDGFWLVASLAAQARIPLVHVFEEVHRSNMSKTRDEGAAGFKVRKGPTYSPPDVKGAIVAGRLALGWTP